MKIFDTLQTFYMKNSPNVKKLTYSADEWKNSYTGANSHKNETDKKITIRCETPLGAATKGVLSFPFVRRPIFPQ